MCTVISVNLTIYSFSNIDKLSNDISQDYMLLLGKRLKTGYKHDWDCIHKLISNCQFAYILSLETHAMLTL